MTFSWVTEIERIHNITSSPLLLLDKVDLAMSQSCMCNEELVGGSVPHRDRLLCWNAVQLTCLEWKRPWYIQYIMLETDYLELLKRFKNCNLSQANPCCSGAQIDIVPLDDVGWDVVMTRVTEVLVLGDVAVGNSKARTGTSAALLLGSNLEVSFLPKWGLSCGITPYLTPARTV